MPELSPEQPIGQPKPTKEMEPEDLGSEQVLRFQRWSVTRAESCVQAMSESEMYPRYPNEHDFPPIKTILANS